MRPPPVVKMPAVQKRDRPKVVTEERKYEVITPLYGGGVSPAEADPITVVRGTSVRGHLRFWWRACRGGLYGASLARMKEAEAQLWGAASEREPRTSQVQIEVSLNHEEQGKPEHPFGDGRPGSAAPGWNVLRYAAFPLQQARGAVRRGVKFTLKITYPAEAEQRQEVEAALWAWETFGGIGARTRRGFGALRLESVNGIEVKPPQTDEVEEVLRKGLEGHIVASDLWPDGVPHLSRVMRDRKDTFLKISGQPASIQSSWEHLIRTLRDFRQKRDEVTHSERAGRSKWPEPNAIRHKFGNRALETFIDKFPRAAFGLPIIFQFIGGELPQTTLRSSLSERMASPLILRPFACADRQSVGLALVLNAPRVPPGGLILKNAPGNPKVEGTLSPGEAERIEPLNDPPPTQADVLQAFLRKL